jgi:hypothetical protein
MRSARSRRNTVAAGISGRKNSGNILFFHLTVLFQYAEGVMRAPRLSASPGIEWFIRTMKVGLRLPSRNRCFFETSLTTKSRSSKELLIIEFRRSADAFLLIIEVSAQPLRFRRNERQEGPSGSLRHGGARSLSAFFFFYVTDPPRGANRRISEDWLKNAASHRRCGRGSLGKTPSCRESSDLRQEKTAGSSRNPQGFFDCAPSGAAECS